MEQDKGSTNKVCVVCSEQASGVYFSAMVCLPCKSFFIRSTKDGDPSFTCVTSNNQCDITLSNRLRCQYCRYQKCLAVGMCRKEKPEVVQPSEGEELCGVCGDIANGVHFGVPTCEGCKKFFRRGLKEVDSYECKDDKKCPVNPRSRNSCRYCRYQRCVHVGMSREAIRMGRPKKNSTDGQKIVKPKRKQSPEPLILSSHNLSDHLTHTPDEHFPLPHSDINTIDKDAFTALGTGSQSISSGSNSMSPDWASKHCEGNITSNLQASGLEHFMGTNLYNSSGDMESFLMFLDESGDGGTEDRNSWPKQRSNTENVKPPCKKIKIEPHSDCSNNYQGYSNPSMLGEINDFFHVKPETDKQLYQQGDCNEDGHVFNKLLCILNDSNDSNNSNTFLSSSPLNNAGNNIGDINQPHHNQTSQSQVEKLVQPTKENNQMEFTEHDRKILHEKLNAKMNLFSKFYWDKPIPLIPKPRDENRKHVFMLAKTVKAYGNLLKATNEQLTVSTPQLDNPNNQAHWPSPPSAERPMWDKIKIRIIQNTIAFIEFTTTCVPDCIKVKEEDFKLMLKYGAFHGMIILSVKDRFDPVEQNFKYFWNWKVPPENPAYLFRKNLMQVGMQIYKMQLDVAETSMLCLLSIMSADWILLKDAEQIEELRKPVVDALCAYILVKYGQGSNRIEELMNIMPSLRKLTLWHGELLQDMKLDIQTDDMKGVYNKFSSMTV